MATRRLKLTFSVHPVALYLGMPDMVRHQGRVKALQVTLREHGFNPGTVDGIFGLGSQAALLAFQRSDGLLADGVAGVRTLAALQGSVAPPLHSVLGRVDTAVVSQMFPHTPLLNIKRNWPLVRDALEAAHLHDRLMVLAALATIRAETESFEPVGEGRSRYNTSPDPAGHPFDLYDHRRDLGNTGAPDGERFRGRGYVQLTGRANYAHYGKAIGLKGRLVAEPDLASDPATAGQLLAAFLKDKERRIKEALCVEDHAAARRCVNGGSHGLDRFKDAYLAGLRLTA